MVTYFPAMSLVKVFVLVLAWGLGFCSLGVYFYNINLWYDQALLFFSGVGFSLGGLALLFLILPTLFRSQVTFPYVSVFLHLPPFVLQFLALVWAVWQKTPG